MSIRSIALVLALAGLLIPGTQAADLSSPPSSATGTLLGLETLQPETSPLDISAFIGVATLIVVFADEPEDRDFIAQIDILRRNVDALAARNVVLLIDTAPSEDRPLRQSLRPRGFSIILIDSNGTLTQQPRKLGLSRRSSHLRQLIPQVIDITDAK